MKTIPNIVGLRAFREETDKYIKEIKKGKSFTVLRKNEPVFKIVPTDVWGDEGTWESVVDFRKINKGKGVAAQKVLDALWLLN